MNKKLSYTLFTEKYRPEKISDMILPLEYKKFFSKLVSEGEIPNLLLYSSTPGTGKTSIAKAICNEIDAEYLYINISSESGIDTLREDISRFAASKNISGTKKIVIMDECDGMTQNLAKALRAEIEHYQNTCRFILTCNYVNKIIPALRSRLQEFDFNMNNQKIRTEMLPKVTKRLCDVLTFEKIVYQKPTIEKLVENLYPDIRKMYQLLQQYSKVNGNIDENIFNVEMVDSQFYDYVLKKKLTLARQFMLDNGYNYEDMYSNMYREFVPLIDDKQKQIDIICLIAEYYHKSSFVNDKEIIFSALLIAIMKVL